MLNTSKLPIKILKSVNWCLRSCSLSDWTHQLRSLWHRKGDKRLFQKQDRPLQALQKTSYSLYKYDSVTTQLYWRAADTLQTMQKTSYSKTERLQIKHKLKQLEEHPNCSFIHVLTRKSHLFTTFYYFWLTLGSLYCCSGSAERGQVGLAHCFELHYY